MTSKVYPYRKGRQFERYIGQFARVFTGFQVQDGVTRGGELHTRTVPVVYGNMSRIVATVLNKRSRNTTASIPVIAVNMLGLQTDETNKRTPHHKDSISLHGTGRDAVMERLIGPQFIMSMEASIYASSMEELFEILEQILLIFNPRVTIQVDTNARNADCITDIILRDIQPEIQYPMSDNNRIVMLTMNFDVPVRLQYPSSITYDTLIKTIHGKIIDENSGEVLSELNIDENGQIPDVRDDEEEEYP